MFPLLQWDKLHLKAWSWLRSAPFQRHVQFGVECHHVQYESKVETIKGIHLLNVHDETSPKGV
jgi:hypothetical protein